jgi:hypothetical protein
MSILPRINKRVLSVSSLDDIEEEKIYWQSAKFQKRLKAVELNRRMVYGEDRVTSRLQRFLETSELVRS